MDKIELESRVNECCTQKGLADHFKVSQTTICYWLKKFDLKTKRQFRGCKMCGELDKSKFYKRRGDQIYGVCKTCFCETHGKKRLERARSIRQEWIEYKGGKCSLCGYNRCVAALEFHHLDPTQKDPNWDKMRGLKLEIIRKELDKCQLLCSNCHKEVHFDHGYKEQMVARLPVTEKVAGSTPVIPAVWCA